MCEASAVTDGEGVVARGLEERTGRVPCLSSSLSQGLTRLSGDIFSPLSLKENTNSEPPVHRWPVFSSGKTEVRWPQMLPCDASPTAEGIQKPALEMIEGASGGGLQPLGSPGSSHTPHATR